MIILMMVLWYLCGCVGFICGSTKRYDFLVSDIPICLLFGFGGPITFIAGYILFKTDSDDDKIIIRRKQNRRLK